MPLPYSSNSSADSDKPIATCVTKMLESNGCKGCYSGGIVMEQWRESNGHGVTIVKVLQCYSDASGVPYCFYSGVIVVFQQCYSGVTVVLQWCYSGVPYRESGDVARRDALCVCVCVCV
jgi:hypothetical protein